jgi:hypothetical protein
VDHLCSALENVTAFNISFLSKVDFKCIVSDDNPNIDFKVV